MYERASLSLTRTQKKKRAKPLNGAVRLLNFIQEVSVKEVLAVEQLVRDQQWKKNTQQTYIAATKSIFHKT